MPLAAFFNIPRRDFGASQGAKSAHTGSMEAMSDAGAVQKQPANCPGYFVTNPKVVSRHTGSQRKRTGDVTAYENQFRRICSKLRKT